MRTSKRTLDRQFYLAQPLFSTELARRYQAFINSCFKTYGGHGTEARFRIGLEYRQQHLSPWDPAQAAYFLPQSDVTTDHVRSTYAALMQQFAIDIGLNQAGAAA